MRQPHTATGLPTCCAALPCPLPLCPTLQATIEWEAQEEGFVARILAPAGSQGISVGTTVAILVEEEGDVAAFKDYTPGAGAAAAKPAAPKAADAAAPAAAAGKSSGASFPPHQVLAMPSLSPTMNQVGCDG